MKEYKLFLTGFPTGILLLVEVIAERKDKPGYFYIRKPSGGTDTTSQKWLFDLPLQISGIDMRRK